MLPPCDHFYVFTEEERRAINSIGLQNGCHTCGTKDPGTRSGSFIGDFQPPSAANWKRISQEIFPHCLICKRIQGVALRDLIFKNGLSPYPGNDTPDCIAFICDAAIRAESITIDREGSIWSASHSIAVGLMSFMDGATEMTFRGQSFSGAATKPQFDGFIETPSRRIGLLNTRNEIVGEPVSVGVRTRIRIWTDHPTEPASIDVLFD